MQKVLLSKKQNWAKYIDEVIVVKNCDYNNRYAYDLDQKMEHSQ